MKTTTKPTSINEILGNWKEVQWKNEIFFLIKQTGTDKINLTHLINGNEVNKIAEFTFSFDEYSQINLKSEVDHYVAFHVEKDFIIIDKLCGRECFRFNLIKIG